LQTKWNTNLKKHSHKKQCMFTVRCHMADWCNKLAEVWPCPLPSSSFTEAVTTITVWELSDNIV
jgi:hypothetical protein